jgi:hypothetical protein
MYLLALLLLLNGADPAEQKSSPPVENDEAATEKAEQAQRLEFMKESLKEYVFTTDGGKPMDLQAEPLLRWNNPVSGVRDGTIFIWTALGRPQAAVQVFQLKQGLWLHEFQSLSTEPFQAKFKGLPEWGPARAGIEMKPAADAPMPAKTERQRLVQMRAIAEQYRAIDDFEDQKSRWELRLLAKPVYRYAVPEGGIIDGALWAFAHGTDPEVFLLLEARETSQGHEWQIGMAPMTAYAVEVSRKDKPVWSAPLREPPWKPREPFFIRVYQP